ncbi:MAG: M24 family metallopeptidase, partial [Pseudomonadota bacterium]
MKRHFSEAEYAARVARAREALGARDLDALLCFEPATQFWLTGYDTFGYCFFQCLVLTADGRMTLLTRSADLRQARLTSTIEDVRVWVDGAAADPATDLRALLAEHGLLGRRLGIEWDTHGLTAAAGRRLEAVLGDAVTLIDASRLVSELRLVKSEAELACVRRAAELADDAFDAALAAAAPGADEALIYAEMHRAIHAAGGDDPGNPFIIGSGPYGLLCRYHTGRRRLDEEDQLTLEWAGTWRHYHAAQMRTVPIGRASERHHVLFDAAAEALLACEDRLRPGHSFGDVFAAHAATLDARGLSAHRLNACGYALGAVYAPSWMDWPMVYADNPVPLAPGMVVFLHMILMDSDTNIAMTLGRTSIVT